MTDLKRHGKLALLLCISTIFWYCREKPVLPVKEAMEVPIMERSSPKVIVDLCAFADIPITDPADIDSLLRFKLIDSSGVIQEIDMKEAARLFKQLKTAKKVTGIPVMEFKQTDKTLIMFRGRGYGEPIWATVLLNNKNHQIEKTAFDHGAESEGYASGMTMTSFENQFTGVEIEKGVTLFGLKQRTPTVIEGQHKVVGISGATVSSQGVINMMNLGIQIYAESFNIK